MATKIHENIRVAAIHGPGRSLRPVWFDWKSHKHTVTEISYHWQHKSGEKLLLHYAVSAGGALYELVYSVTDQLWMLESIDAEGGYALTRPLATLSQRERVNCVLSPSGREIERG